MKFETEINFQSNTWNRDAWARIQADLDTMLISAEKIAAVPTFLHRS